MIAPDLPQRQPQRENVPPEDRLRTLNILDSVCVLYFAASGQTKLLVAILTAANYSILLPAEVLRECEGKARVENWNITSLNDALGGPIQLIPAISAAQPRTMRALTTLRRGHPAGVKGSANLGECVCIAHALGARSKAIPVVVFIDDGDGQTLAKANNVPFFAVEDALVAGVDHGVITRSQARAAYVRMVPFGSSLPTWDASELQKRLKK